MALSLDLPQIRWQTSDLSDFPEQGIPDDAGLIADPNAGLLCDGCSDIRSGARPRRTWNDDLRPNDACPNLSDSGHRRLLSGMPTQHRECLTSHRDGSKPFGKND